MWKKLAGCLVGMCFASGIQAGVLSSSIEDQKSVEVTVYNSNLGLVKDTRRLKLATGPGELRFMDVASGILPYTVHIQPLSGKDGLHVLEQNYEYDLMDDKKLLDKYVGKTIKLLNVNPYQDKKETIEAQLLSNNSSQIYKINNEIYLGHPGYKILPEIPENLIAKPTLTWAFDNKDNEDQDVQVSYLTNGINWKADYVLVIDSSDSGGNLSGWVTLDNQSGATYNDAKLKLVAGTVNRVQAMSKGYVQQLAGLAARKEASEAEFQEQGFFEYHLYDLQRKTTIKDNQTKQIRLLEAPNIRLQKGYTVQGNWNYYFANYNYGNTQPIKIPVNVSLKFKNAKDNGMGMPLPAGTVRLYKADAQKSLQFIGEDAVGHTPKDEDVELRVGEAFDVVAQREQKDFQQNANVYKSMWEVTVRNHKDEDINVALLEPMYGDWQVLESSVPYKKTNAQTLRFDVEVPKDQEVKVTYQVSVKRN